MKFKRISSAVAILCIALLAPAFAAYAQNKPGWDLVWADEFDGPNVNTAKWSISNGAANVNQELEYYSNSSKNVFIQNGCLVLRAIKEDFGGRNYTSGKMTSAGKGDWLYGRFEVRAKLNNGQGMWPAIWMMPTDGAYGGWPSSGEMDIMELLGHQPNRVYGTIHWATNGAHQQAGSSYTLKTGTFADTFHVFGYEWEAGKQRWYVDDSLYFSTTHGQPLDKRFFYILNVAVGGSWPGNPNSTTVFPNDMLVDYARVYRKSTSISEPVRRQDIGPCQYVFQNNGVFINKGLESKVSLVDLSGRVMQQRILSSGGKFDFGRDLPDGMYLLQVISGAGMQTQKFIKSGKTSGRPF
jgi:beta-glucanase (GH16 family)